MGFPGKYDKTDNGRQLTSKLWRDFNPMALAGNPADGWMVLNDFHMLPDVLSYSLTAGGAEGTITLDGTAANGVALLSAANTAAGDGPNIEFLGMGALPAKNAVVAFEVRIKTATITDSHFVGMGGGSATAVIDTLPTDYAGFWVTDGGADWTFGQQNGSADTEVDVYTAVANTYGKLGFRLHNGETEIYVNGEPYTHSLTAASHPSATDEIFPILACESEGAAAIMHVDWMAVGCLTA